MGWHWGTWGPRGDKEHPSNHLNHFTTTSPKKEPAGTEWWQKGMPKEMSQRRGYLQPVLPGLCSLNTCVSWPALVSQPLRSPSWVRVRRGLRLPALYGDPSLSHSVGLLVLIITKAHSQVRGESRKWSKETPKWVWSGKSQANPAQKWVPQMGEVCLLPFPGQTRDICGGYAGGEERFIHASVTLSLTQKVKDCSTAYSPCRF